MEEDLFSFDGDGAGTDLLNLISDILDLSKIESGTVSVEAEEVFFTSVLEMVARPFRHEAENRKLSFDLHTDTHLSRSLVTDSKRLQQVLKNLLSNALKFTEQGGVRLSVFNSGCALELNLAAKQAGELTADGEAEAGATVFAAGAGIGLLEGLEDDLLLLLRDADSGVGDFEGDDGAAGSSIACSGAPAAGARRNRKPHAAVLGELEGV